MRRPDEPDNIWWWIAQYYAAQSVGNHARMTELKDGAWARHHMILGALLVEE